jgi:hypothetical protein
MSIINWLTPQQFTVLVTIIILVTMFYYYEPKSFLRGLLAYILAIPLSIIASEVMIWGVRLYYLQPPPDYHGKLPNKLYLGNFLERFDAAEVNRFNELRGAFPEMFAHGKCKDCDANELLTLKITLADLRSCDGLKPEGEFGGYLDRSAKVVHIVTHPKTCLKIEQIKKIPDEAASRLNIIDDKEIGKIVISKKISGFAPYHRNFFREGRKPITGKNVIPVENCLEFSLSYLDLAAGYSFGHINPPDSNTMCVSNNLKKIAGSR